MENKGQWPSQVHYKLELKGHRIWVENQALTFQIVHSDAHPLGLVHAERENRKVEKPNLLAHNYRITFLGANVSRIEGSDYQSGTFNYFVGNDPSHWTSGARSCESVQYANLYAGVDLKLYGEGQRLKYDFYLKPGSKHTDIQLQYSGVDGLRLKQGKLLISTAMGTVEERIPKAYQLIDGQARMVTCRFTLKEKVVGFDFPDGLNPSYPTVIDPVINFFTYSGSLADNWGNTAVSDSAGNAYTAGTVYGSFYPATLGVIDQSFNGNTSDAYSTYDVGILKFDSTGKKLLWCTYLGGANADSPYSLAIDTKGNLMVMGTTSSTNFPTTVGAFQRTHHLGPPEFPYGSSPGFKFPEYQKGSDLFVCRIQANGKKILASTMIGGSGTDGLMTVYDQLTSNYGDQFRSDVLVGKDGSVFVASHTKSIDFPTKLAFQDQLKGLRDGILLKMNEALTSIIWSTYVGGSRDDALYSLQLIGNDKVAVAGGSTSSDFPTTAGAYKSVGIGVGVDAVVAVYSQQTGQLLAGSYTQTPEYDQAYLVQGDNQGNVYLFGQTKGQMPVSQNVYAQPGGGQFIQKFSSDLTTLLWGTTFGTTLGQPNLVPSAFLVDSCNHIYLSGWGGIINNRSEVNGLNYIGGFTNGLPVTSDAFQSGTDGSDFYFMVLSKDAKALLFATYYGQTGGRGEHVDGGTSRFDRRGIVTQAICGCIDEEDNFFHGSAGSYQPNINSNNCNNGVMKLNLLDLVAKIKSNINVEAICPLTLSFNNLSVNGTSYTWYFGNGDSLTSSAPTIFYQYEKPGTYLIRLKAVNPTTCRYQAFDDTTLVIPNPFPFQPDTTVDLFCVGDTLHPVFPELARYQLTWNPSRWVSDAHSFQPTVVPLGSTLYTIEVKDSSGCKTRKYYALKNRKLTLKFDWQSSTDPCLNAHRVVFTSTGDTTETMTWDFGDGITDTGRSVSHVYIKGGRYEVRLNGSRESCIENAFQAIVLTDKPVTLHPDFTTEKKYGGCNQPTTVFKNLSINADAFYWDFGDGFQSTETDPQHFYEKPGTYLVKLKAYQGKCAQEKSLSVVVEDLVIPTLITSNDDNKNEIFKIQGLEPGAGLDLFDRWGKKIFSSDNYRNDWKPDHVQPGTYFFNLHFSGEAHCNGWVEVLR